MDDNPNGKQLPEFTDKIEFKNVRFAYDDAVILDDINLSIQKGKTVALVGSSGAGKSTLADLVPRFHDVQLLDRLYSRREHYSGLSARLLGLIILLFGTGILFHTIVEWMNPGRANAFLVSLVDTNRGRGVLCIAFGFFIFLFGLIRLISGSAHSPELHSGAVDLGFRLWGLLGMLIGILLSVVGAWWMFVP